MNKFIFSVKNLFRINWYRYLRDYLRLRAAIQTADEQHAKDGDRYYVIPSTDGKLLIMDRKNFRAMKRKHYIGKNVTLNDLKRECFYHTPYANRTGAITPEERNARANSYYAWCSIQHSIKNKKKKHYGKQGN